MNFLHKSSLNRRINNVLHCIINNFQILAKHDLTFLLKTVISYSNMHVGEHNNLHEKYICIIVIRFLQLQL